MNERGLSHIEVILAFILFIGAAFTIFYFFNPSEKTHVDDYALLNLFESIQKETSSTVSYFSVKINNTDNQIIRDNYENGSIVFDSGEVFSFEADIVVRNLSGSIIYAGKNASNGNILCFNAIEAGDFALVYVSSNITNPKKIDYECNNINESYFTLAASDKELLISEVRSLEFNKTYFNNYPVVRDLMGLPRNRDFDFSIVFDSGKRIGEKKEIPEQLEVKALNKRIKIITKQGEIKTGVLEVRMWGI